MDPDPPRPVPSHWHGHGPSAQITPTAPVQTVQTTPASFSAQPVAHYSDSGVHTHITPLTGTVPVVQTASSPASIPAVPANSSVAYSAVNMSCRYYYYHGSGCNCSPYSAVAYASVNW